MKVTFENDFKWSQQASNPIAYINISKERIYHLGLQLASPGRTGNGKTERHVWTSALQELPRGDGGLALGL